MPSSRSRTHQRAVLGWAEQITRLFTEPRSTRHKSTTNEPSIRPGSFTELPHEVASGRACSAHPHSQSPRRPSTCESMRATGAQTPVCFHRRSEEHTSELQSRELISYA